jgi:Raf kinase inhibitor-like YbhB/YbcL family protein
MYTCEGRDVSPPLKWASVPAATKSFAVVCDDPDAPGGIWVHWVLYNISPKARELPEAIPRDNTLKDGSCQGTNDFPFVGYGGPCPPRGKPHRYFFKVYALDARLDLKPGVTKEELLRAMKGHVLGSGELIGTFGR